MEQASPAPNQHGCAGTAGFNWICVFLVVLLLEVGLIENAAGRP